MQTFMKKFLKKMLKREAGQAGLTCSEGVTKLLITGKSDHTVGTCLCHVETRLAEIQAYTAENVSKTRPCSVDENYLFKRI